MLTSKGNKDNTYEVKFGVSDKGFWVGKAYCKELKDAGKLVQQYLSEGFDSIEVRKVVL